MKLSIFPKGSNKPALVVEFEIKSTSPSRTKEELILAVKPVQNVIKTWTLFYFTVTD
jgi:hypothetical protein